MSYIDLDFTGDAEPAPPTHTCSICGKPLSRYNNTGVCFHHPDIKKAQRQAKLTEKAHENELRAVAIQANQARLAEEKLAINEKERIRQDLIFDLVCNDFSLSRDEILQPGRKAVFVQARHVLMYLLYNDTSLSYPAIGEFLGGRDHTTVIHGTSKIESELQTCLELKNRIQRLRSLYSEPTGPP